MAEVHRAGWVLRIAGPPIRDGWVLVDAGLVAAVGGPTDAIPGKVSSHPGSASSGPGDSRAILPGLVNAHAHLEVSWMRGQIAPADSMPAWAARLVALRRSAGADAPEPIVEAVAEMRAAGTALVGDVTNTLVSYAALADSHLSAMVFRELLGFNARNPRQLVSAALAGFAELTPLARVRTALAPHAPYSVSAELFREIAAAARGPVSVHLGESAEEIEFLRSGTGPWRALLEQVGVWQPGWTPPGCGPVEYLDRLGLVDARLLAVHGVQLTDAELGRLAAAGATVVTCPRSNRWTGAGLPPVARFYASGVRVAIGTDSLASVEDFNMFNEIAAVRALAPGLPAASILRSATLDGAAALGFGGELGSIEPGKRAELIAVRVPAGVEDVEEYLVSGVVRGDHVSWLERRGPEEQP